MIAVADTGRGIPTDEIDTIFDEYRQVKGSDKEHKGTGLGLSITKKFAELLGGLTRYGCDNLLTPDCIRVDLKHGNPFSIYSFRR